MVLSSTKSPVTGIIPNYLTILLSGLLHLSFSPHHYINFQENQDLNDYNTLEIINNPNDLLQLFSPIKFFLNEKEDPEYILNSLCNL